MSAEHCCKVDRVRAAHDISPPGRANGALDTYLVDRWTGRGEAEPTGLRTLAEWFNKQVLRAVYREHGRPDSSVRINSDYAALQGEEIPDHQRAELLSELAADGIDGESTARQFIGKSTLSRHLKGCLGASKETPEAETEWEIDRIRVATGSYRSHLESALGSLDTKGRIAGVDEADLQIQATLSCPECPTRVNVETAYEQGYVCEDHHDDS
ncbi:rod-determining factor RdfA [Halohasta salina]|uniref:rod-determining factor RdfA n=1 Tax=Halohasta salina TaxID=2961621 RepID=UPI0020A3B488|nr:rod-determining factor RdfA [Halohasta salina]